MRIAFGTILITQKFKDLIAEVLDLDRLSSGKYVREFEWNVCSLGMVDRDSALCLFEVRKEDVSRSGMKEMAAA